jgi:hypothetical protein
MWVLRAYHPADDELIEELPLPYVDDDAAARIIGHAPTKWASTPMSSHAQQRLTNFVHFVPRDGLEYFMDFDADPQQVAEPSKPATAATT